MSWPVRPDPAARDPAASMALLREVLDRPLDPGYESAAAERREQGRTVSTGPRSPVLLGTTLLLGLLFAVSAHTLRTPDPQDAAERSELVVRIETANLAGDAFAEQAERLRAQIAGPEEAALTGAPADLSEDLLRAAILVGASAVTGPGVVITLDDAPRDDLDPALPHDDRVLAKDLQFLVNGLWGSGAEAVAVNDQRLTTTAAIRFAGEAIIVDFRGLTRPYVVRAIGDPQTLAAEVTDGSTGAYLTDLTAEYGIIVDVATQDELTLPAAERMLTRVATVGPPRTATDEEPTP